MEERSVEKNTAPKMAITTRNTSRMSAEQLLKHNYDKHMIWLNTIVKKKARMSQQRWDHVATIKFLPPLLSRQRQITPELIMTNN
tara:strand:- start:1009 stop:1263 length:255 start_codon:yes stop_codon:yes gene_type:complete